MGELGTVMLSAHMTSNGLMEKPTWRIGVLPRPTRMLALESMDPAVVRWTSGRPTPNPRPTHLILAPLRVSTDVRVQSVVTTLVMRDTTESVTGMAATLPHSGLETRPTGVLAQSSPLTAVKWSLLSLNSSLPMAQILG